MSRDVHVRLPNCAPSRQAEELPLEMLPWVKSKKSSGKTVPQDLSCSQSEGEDEGPTGWARDEDGHLVAMAEANSWYHL